MTCPPAISNIKTMKNLYTDILNPLHMIIGDADHVGDALDNVDEMIKFLIQKNPFVQNDLVEFIKSKNAQYNNDTTPKITKIFGKDFDSNGGALTLERREVTDDENAVSGRTYTKTHESGWTITGKIFEDCFTWVNHFEAHHPYFGKVWGDFESEVYADTEKGFADFYKNHTPEAWDYHDI